jgi:hypothetical protein
MPLGLGNGVNSPLGRRNSCVLPTCNHHIQKSWPKYAGPDTRENYHWKWYWVCLLEELRIPSSSGPISLQSSSGTLFQIRLYEPTTLGSSTILTIFQVWQKVLSRMEIKNLSDDLISIYSPSTITHELSAKETHSISKESISHTRDNVGPQSPGALSPGRFWVIFCGWVYSRHTTTSPLTRQQLELRSLHVIDEHLDYFNSTIHNFRLFQWL